MCPPLSSLPSMNLFPSFSHLVTQFQPLASLHALQQIKTSCPRAFALAVCPLPGVFFFHMFTQLALSPPSHVFTHISLSERPLYKRATLSPMLPISLPLDLRPWSLLTTDTLHIYVFVSPPGGRALFCSLLYPQCLQPCLDNEYLLNT